MSAPAPAPSVRTAPPRSGTSASAREVVLLTVPQLGLMLCHMGMSMTDVAVTGLISPAAQASLGAVGQVFTLLMLVASLAGSGCLAAVSQALGMGLARRAARYAALIVLLALILTFWILFGGRNRNPGNSSSETSEGSTVSDEWLVPSREESDRSEPGSMSPSSQEESSAESSAVSSEPEESSAEPIRMANFVGQKYADVLADAKNKAVYIFSEPEYVYSDQYAEGIVADQDVTPGIEITEGTRVSLKVSKGSQYVTLPSYEKKKEKEYLDELSAMGITNVIVSYREDPLFKQDGYVVGTSLGADGRYDITKKPVLEIYVSKKD